MFVVIWEYIIRMMMEFLTYKLSHSLENKKKKKKQNYTRQATSDSVCN